MKRILAVLSALLMILSLVSCGNTKDKGSTSTSGGGEVTTENALVSNLPKYEFEENEQISILSCDREWWWAEEVSPIEDNDSVINNAVATRNAFIEETMKVKINSIKVPYTNDASVVNPTKKSSMDGDDLYDATFCNIYQAAIATIDGYFVDLKTVKTLDLSKDFWLQSLNEQMSFHGRQFVASGDISISTVRMAFATIFNKQLFDNAHVPYLYKTVEDKNWTLEYQLGLLETFHSGEGTSDEQFGFISSDKILSDCYWEACDNAILRKNADGDYEFVTDIARLESTIGGVIALFKSAGTKCWEHETADAEIPKISKDFADGNGAMATILLNECEKEWLREMKDPYGIVPIPKLNRDQETHHTHLFDQYTCITVVKQADYDRYEPTGALLQALAYASQQITMPAYYELTLKQKYQSDPTSWDMLDMIMDNVVCDAGNLYFSLVGRPHAELGKIVLSRENTTAHSFQNLTRSISIGVKNLNQALINIAK